jgi:hypothetical protein
MQLVFEDPDTGELVEVEGLSFDEILLLSYPELKFELLHRRCSA